MQLVKHDFNIMKKQYQKESKKRKRRKVNMDDEEKVNKKFIRRGK